MESSVEFRQAVNHDYGIKFLERMRRMNDDDDDDEAVDREREVAITCSIFQRFHNIRLARRGAAPFCPISDP